MALYTSHTRGPAANLDICKLDEVWDPVGSEANLLGHCGVHNLYEWWRVFVDTEDEIIEESIVLAAV